MESRQLCKSKFEVIAAVVLKIQVFLDVSHGFVSP
jgi:hypothetical protein